MQMQTFWTKIKDSFFVALTAILTVLLVVLIVWFVIRIIPKTFSFFRNGVATTLDTVFIPDKNVSSLIDKKTIVSGEVFTLSLGAGASEDLYTMSHPCTDGVSFSLANAQNTKIECGQDFFLLNTESDVPIVGYSTKNRISIVPIKIGLQRQDSQEIEIISNFNLTITNRNYSNITEDAPPSSIDTDNTPTNTYTPPTNIYIGKADLSVKITDTGIINKNTFQFTKTSIISSNDRVGIKFEVKNTGDRATGVWVFNATLPSQTSPSYQSDPQISLNPGDKIEFTLGFDNPINTYSINTVKINVDPFNYINEISEVNNIASANITNYYYGYDNGSLVASCYGIPSNPAIGENVTWYAVATGGSGTYNYSWTGTDNLAGSSQSIGRVYYTGGQKSANVIVSSGGYSVSRTCAVNINNYYNYNNSDLSARLIGVGMLDSSNNFVYATQAPIYSNVAIKFEVTNNGTGDSGPWNLSANMSPSMSYYSYGSNSYPSLAPGQRTEVIINFSNVNSPGNNSIFVKVDPNNTIGDTNRSNNDIVGTIYIY